MKQQLLQKIESARTPGFGNLLSKSFDLFKKVWMDSFMHVVVTFLVATPLIFFVYVPFIPAIIKVARDGGTDQIEPNFDFPILSMVAYVLMVFVLIFVVQMITIGITAHFYKVCRIKDLDTKEDAGSYFSYLKGVNFGKVFKLSLANFGISIAAMLLCYLPIFYVMVPLQLMVVIFAFNKELSVLDILSISFKLGNKFWLLVFGLMIVSSLLAQLGIILCFVGLFFTAYFVCIPIYYFYKETIGFVGDTEEFTEDFSTQYSN
tara:strand:+ start:14170 stop:14955 length:786 start_codon:yes stop_codon:yes gene_type:complete